ncbi:MAG: hypothetical protein ACOXZK_00590 [Bacteroidales bacterium]
MKRFFLIAITIMSSWAIMAQNDAPNKGTNKDRINFGAVNSFWLGLEDGMKQRPISQGFNGSIMIDIKTSENSPISFWAGLWVFVAQSAFKRSYKNW